MLHSLIQRNLLVALSRYPSIFAVPELRSRTRETRYSWQDVSVVLRPPQGSFLIEAAHIAIEILSDDDRMSQVLEELAEYEAAGVPNIWLVDPRCRKECPSTPGAASPAVDRFEAGEIVVTAEEVFRNC